MLSSYENSMNNYDTVKKVGDLSEAGNKDTQHCFWSLSLTLQGLVDSDFGSVMNESFVPWLLSFLHDILIEIIPLTRAALRLPSMSALSGSVVLYIPQ